MLCCCHSTKAVVEETNLHESMETSVDSTRQIVSAIEENARINHKATDVRADEVGRVEIERDSMGRPIVVYWAYNWKLHDKTFSQGAFDEYRYEFKNSYHREDTGNSDRTTTITEESTVEIDPTMPIESIIWKVLSICSILIIIYLALRH